MTVLLEETISSTRVRSKTEVGLGCFFSSKGFHTGESVALKLNLEENNHMNEITHRFVYKIKR